MLDMPPVQQRLRHNPAAFARLRTVQRPLQLILGLPEECAWGRDMTPNDKALVAGVSDKSREALGEIYRRYGGAVWSVAKRVCRDPGRAEHVCQAVFNELWTAPDRFDQSRGTLRSCLVAEA